MMMEDLPMADDNYVTDAEMMVEYEAYDYEMQEDPAPDQNQIQEYDMDADVEVDAIVPDVEETPIVDVPIVEELPVPAPADVPIVEEAISPQPIPLTSPPQTAPIALAAPSFITPQPLISYEATVLAPTSISEPQNLQPELEQTQQITEHVPTPQPVVTRLPTPPAPAPEVAVDTAVPAEVAAAPQEIVNQTETVEQLTTEVSAPTLSPSHEAAALSTEPAAVAPVSLEPIIPSIRLFFDDKSFVLFHHNPSEQEEEAPIVLLDGQPEFFAAPLAEFLLALRHQEGARFPVQPDCVLGLEYPNLDLCIDENSKYATQYTLKDICSALIACNHFRLDVTLYQITDFEQSLQQRLKGVVPEITYEESSSEEVVDTSGEVAEEDTLEVPEDEADAEGEVDNTTGTILDNKDVSSEANQSIEEPLPAQTEEATVPEVSQDQEPTTIAVTEVDATVETSGPAPHIEEADGTEEYDEHEHDPAQYEDAPETEEQQAQHELPEADDDANAEEPTADNGSESSTGTLESSTHGEIEQYNDNEEHTAPELLQQAEDASADGVELPQADPESEYDDGEDELYDEEYDAAPAAADHGEPGSSGDLLAHEEANAGPTDLPAPSTSETSAQATQDASNEDPLAANLPEESADGEEYEYYEDDFEDELAPTTDAVDNVEPTLTESAETAVEKVSPVEPVRKVTTPNKRTLDDRDEYEDEYGDEGYYEADTKRARLEL